VDNLFHFPVFKLKKKKQEISEIIMLYVSFLGPRIS